MKKSAKFSGTMKISYSLIATIVDYCESFMAVYVLSDRPNNRLKIGYTANLPKRLQTHRTSNPGLEVFAVLEEGDRNAEKAIHRLMQGHRISGTTEWYRDSAIVRQVLARVWTKSQKDGQVFV
jgi:hypothetical protein